MISTSVDGLLHDTFEIFVGGQDKLPLGLLARVLYRKFPEPVVECTSVHGLSRELKRHLLQSHFPANPFPSWSWLILVLESIHYRVFLLSDFGGLGHI